LPVVPAGVSPTQLDADGRSAGKGDMMVKTFDDVQKLNKDTIDATLKSLGALSTTAQAIAVEMADYSKKAFEDGAAASEKLIGAKSLEAAFEVQSSYLKSAYEGFVAQSTRLGELYSGLAQETCKPFASGLKAVAMK
jgi:hypothetical protein